jgi:hypothetical protein
MHEILEAEPEKQMLMENDNARGYQYQVHNPHRPYRQYYCHKQTKKHYN